MSASAASTLGTPAVPAEAHEQFSSFVAPTRTIVGALPEPNLREQLKQLPAAEPPPPALATLGLVEGAQTVDAAIWREVRRALAKQGGKTVVS